MTTAKSVSEKLLESSLRVEALLVALVLKDEGLPPHVRRRMNEEDDFDMIGMIFNGSTAEEAAAAIRERRAAYGGRGGSRG